MSPDSRDELVRLRGVSRRFGDVEALRELDLSVTTGSITVLLGPNGAGKTTAIRMITGALDPDAGAIRVFGVDPADHGQAVRERCGVVSAKPSLYDRLSGWDNLRYAAELYGLGRSADARIREAASTFGIEGSLDHEVGGYSTGMKTRLALARAVLHRPDLLLLDEPTSGLDPESALAVLELIRTMTSDGQTVLMCTHLLLEAEGLADEIIILQHGSNLISGRPDDLAARLWPSPEVQITSTDESGLDQLREGPGIIGFERVGEVASVRLDAVERIPELVALLTERRVPVTGVIPFTPTLEDLYFAVRRNTGSSGDEIAPPDVPSGRPSRDHLPMAA